MRCIITKITHFGFQSDGDVFTDMDTIIGSSKPHDCDNEELPNVHSKRVQSRSELMEVNEDSVENEINENDLQLFVSFNNKYLIDECQNFPMTRSC